MGILQTRMMEWFAMPSSRGSSQLRDQTQVSCTAGRFFTNLILIDTAANILLSSSQHNPLYEGKCHITIPSEIVVDFIPVEN